MTTYYVRTDGSNSNAGTSSSTSGAWQTLTKALGATGIASGDTVYVAPGTYREVVSVAMTSATVETKVIGDVSASQFSDLAGGRVILTAYTTDDVTTPSASTTLALSGRDFLTFEDIIILGGQDTCLTASSTSTNITLRRCTFIGHTLGIALVQAETSFGVNASWLVEKCVFHQARSLGYGIRLLSAVGTGADYDIGLIVRNCLFARGEIAVGVDNGGGSGTNKPGGGAIYCNTMLTSGGVMVNTTNASTSIPMLAYSNYIAGRANGLYANTSGQITEDYNAILSGTSYVNVTGGANSVTGYRAASYSLGAGQLYGEATRPLGEPWAGSWIGTFGNDGTYTSSEDLFGNPRPAGGGNASKAIGAFSRANTFAKETGTVRTGSNAISITGPGTQDFQLPVDATSTTVTCYVRWDATYAGTKPQMKVLNCEEAGVTAASTTATGSSGAWEQLSLNFTPTRAGIVTIRLQSNDTNGAGKMYADDFDVS